MTPTIAIRQKSSRIQHIDGNPENEMRQTTLAELHCKQAPQLSKWADLVQVHKRQFTPCNLLRVAFLVPPRNIRCQGGLLQTPEPQSYFRHNFGYEPHWSRDVMSSTSISQRVSGLAKYSITSLDKSAIFQRGVLRLCLGHSEARDDLAHVSDLIPQNAALKGHLLLSHLLTDSNQEIKEQLIPQLVNFVRDHEEESVGHLALFKALATLKDIDTARRVMTRGLQLHPENFGLLAAAAWFSIDHDDTRVALRFTQRVFLKFPENDALWPSLLRFQRAGHSRMRDHLKKCYGARYLIEDLSLRAPPWWINPNLANVRF